MQKAIDFIINEKIKSNISGKLLVTIQRKGIE